MELRKDSKIVTQFMPSFAHLAGVRIAISFFPDFLNDLQTLGKVYKDIEHGISASIDDPKAKKAEERLLLIPPHLRDAVFKTIIGMSFTNCIWKMDHVMRDFKKANVFHKSDGTIDRTVTAKKFIQNENINITDRFRLACMYCFEKSIVSLWSKMEASGEAKDFEAGGRSIVSLWVKWMQEGHQIPWLQAIQENLIPSYPPSLSSTEDRFLISPFFTLLRPEERGKFLPCLKWTTMEDFRLSLCAATKEEEVKVLEEDAQLLLLVYLQWPLQSAFLETAEKIWRFLDVESFSYMLNCLWKTQEIRKDFDFSSLFVDFWEKSPKNLKEAVENNPTMNKTIKSMLNKIKRRKKQSILDKNQSNWVRRNGRLESAKRI